MGESIKTNGLEQQKVYVSTDKVLISMFSSKFLNFKKVVIVTSSHGK